MTKQSSAYATLLLDYRVGLQPPRNDGEVDTRLLHAVRAQRRRLFFLLSCHVPPMVIITTDSNAR